MYHFPAAYSGAAKTGLPVSGIKGAAVQLGAGETHALALTKVGTLHGTASRVPFGLWFYC